MMQRWRFGGIQGWLYTDEFRAAMAGNGVAVDMTAPTLLVLGRMLVAGRIDIAAAGPGLAHQVAMADPEVGAQLVALSGPVLHGGPVFIAFTRMADGPAKAKAFATAASGTFESSISEVQASSPATSGARFKAA